MATVLFDRDDHKVLLFSNLVTGTGVQSNQFLVTDDSSSAVLDPGGDLTFTALSIELSKIMQLDSVRLILASHQDPDIITSLPRWLTYTHAQVAISSLWQRFLPHLASTFVTSRAGAGLENRILGIEDKGARLRLGKNHIWVLPAHFMHSVGNFSFYDPVSEILFSGDIGASVGAEADRDITTAAEFRSLAPHMEGFHQRYMTSNKVCRFWVEMVRKLRISCIAPQHGCRLKGEAIECFLSWLEQLECGVDLLMRSDYQLPQ